MSDKIYLHISRRADMSYLPTQLAYFSNVTGEGDRYVCFHEDVHDYEKAFDPDSDLRKKKDREARKSFFRVAKYSENSDVRFDENAEIVLLKD
jgi:hypothetical protein